MSRVPDGPVRVTGRGPGVVVVGSITADVTSFSERLPVRGETVLGHDFTLLTGGKGANQAIAAARAGTATWLAACVGSDLLAGVVLDGLSVEGVDTSSVLTVPGPTGVAHIRVDASGENDIVMVPLANAHLTPQRAEQALDGVGDRAGVLLLQLEIPVATAVHAARLGRERGYIVILDPAPAPVHPLDPAVWSFIDVVTPNEAEAGRLTGVPVVDFESAARAGQWFLDRGVRAAVVTLAGQGACVVTSEGAVHHPSFAVDPVDTTAAGDAFAGQLGACLAAGMAWEAALVRAMAAGALAVTVAGASPSLPTAAEVDTFLARVHAPPSPSPTDAGGPARGTGARP